MNSQSLTTDQGAQAVNGESDVLADPRIPDSAGRSLAEMTADERGRFQLQIADYIEGICAELRAMAQAAELNGLAYFIDMARLEASTQVASRNRADEAG